MGKAVRLDTWKQRHIHIDLRP